MQTEEILSGLKKGQEHALRSLFDTCYDSLVLFANHFVNDAEAAKDIVQDCFVDLWLCRRFDHITDGLDKYLFRAVKNASLNYLRGCERREKHHLLALADEQDNAEDTKLSEEGMELLYEAINRLPEERKRIFMMICLEGKKYREVADELNISINTVRTQMGRAFQYLRSELQGRGYSFFLSLFFRRIICL